MDQTNPDQLSPHRVYMCMAVKSLIDLPIEKEDIRFV